ncbi:MAG: nucleotidyltransferase family protein [Archangium sp.]|nr:nucleotidyltransferase family protein [Archangium sp.]
MAASMLELFRTLTSFSPPRTELKDAPWETFVPWAIGQGLASLCAYNLEYRLGSAGSPEWVRHRLLSLYQGMANDNVMKLVNLKRSIDDLEGRKIVLVGSASFAESLYPHVAFRPVIDVRLLVPAADVEPLTTWLRRSEFKAEPVEDRGGAAKVLNDTRTQIFLHGGFFEDKAQNEALMSRTLPMKPFGPSARRLDLEDALVVQVLLMARFGFDVPMLDFIDLRELCLGAPSMGGVYSRELDAAAVLARASAWKLDRALWCAMSVVEKLWPETSKSAARLKPDLSFPVREVLERLVVNPLSEVGRTEGVKGEDALRSLLAGE